MATEEKPLIRPIEAVDPPVQEGLTARIRDFWSENVNAERIQGRVIAQSPRGSDAYFQEIEAQRYRSHRHLAPWIDSMLAGRSVLEVGCGIGIDTFRMSRRGVHVTAMDLTEVGVATARTRFRRHRAQGRFLAGDACHLPFSDNRFDYVYSFGVLHHAADTERTIHEVHRVLKPGGEALIMLYHRRSLNELAHRIVRRPFEEKDVLCPVVRRFTRGEVRRMFSAFSRVELTLEFVYGEGYGLIFRLTPRVLYWLLSKLWGWHIMIRAVK